jgi:hypothetical protein
LCTHVLWDDGGSKRKAEWLGGVGWVGNKG